MSERRPIRDRVWFWKPQWYWHGRKTLIPFFTGGDEYDWHTVCIGWTITGRVIIATRPCPGTGRCREYAETEGLATWPNHHFVLFDRGTHLEADPCTCSIGKDHDSDDYHYPPDAQPILRRDS